MGSSPWAGTGEGDSACSEARFQTMLNALANPVWLAKADGCLAWCNGAWRGQVGLPGDGLPEGPWWAALEPAARAQAQGCWRQAVAQGTPFRLELPFPGANGPGPAFLVLAQPVPDPFGPETRWFGSCMDVSQAQDATNRIQRQGALHSAINSLFQRALEGATVAEVAVASLEAAQQLTGSRRGLIALLNPAPQVLALRGPGVATRDLERLPLALPSPWAAELQAGRAVQLEAGGLDPDWAPGFPGQAEVLAIALQQDSRTFGFLALADKPSGFTAEDRELLTSLLGAFRLAYDRLCAQRRIEELNEVLARRSLDMAVAMKELDAFTFSVAHDLRAPLRHLGSFAELLLRETEGELRDKPRAHVNTIHEAARHMEKLIEGLLALSMSARTLTKGPVALDALLAEVIRGLGPQSEGRRIRWELTPLPTVQADRTLLHSALSNLLSNALKFTRTREEAVIQVGLVPHPTATVLFVQDNGVGFPPRQIDRLFGVFQRLHPGQEFEGLGIGLANVRKIVNLHGGRTWAEGEPGQGATFFVALH